MITSSKPDISIGNKTWRNTNILKSYFQLHYLKMYFIVTVDTKTARSSWSWTYSSWIYNYLSNQGISPLTLWVRTPFRRRVLDTTLCDKVCQWLATGPWFSLGTPVSSTYKTYLQDITEILLKLALNTIIKLTSFF